MATPLVELLQGKVPPPKDGRVHVLGVREMDFKHAQYDGETPFTPDMKLCVSMKRLIVEGFKDALKAATESECDSLFNQFYAGWEFAICYFDRDLRRMHPYDDRHNGETPPTLVGVCLLNIRMPDCVENESSSWGTSVEVAASKIPYIYVWGLCVADGFRGQRIPKVLFEEADRVKDAMLQSMREHTMKWQMSQPPSDMPLVLDIDIDWEDDEYHVRTENVFANNGFVPMSEDDIERTDAFYTVPTHFDEDRDKRLFRYSYFPRPAEKGVPRTLDPLQRNIYKYYPSSVYNNEKQQQI